jgi:hypothetical protein
MNHRTKRGLKLAAAAIFAALLVAITVNGAVDFWMPQAELKESSAPPVSPAEPATLQMPLAAQPLPAAPLPQQPAAASAPPQWNQPLFEPKFDGPGFARNGGGAQTFTAPDFSNALNQFAPLSQIQPPSLSLPGADPAPVSIRPIFGGKSGGVESGALGAAGNLPGAAGSTVGGAASGAGSLLKR